MGYVQITETIVPLDLGLLRLSTILLGLLEVGTRLEDNVKHISICTWTHTNALHLKRLMTEGY
jgi:hypothetical protein